MLSKSKYKIDNLMIEKLFIKAGIGRVCNIKPLGAGEYNSVYSADKLVTDNDCKMIDDNKQFVIKIAPSGTDSMLTYETNE